MLGWYSNYLFATLSCEGQCLKPPYLSYEIIGRGNPFFRPIQSTPIRGERRRRVLRQLHFIDDLQSSKATVELRHLKPQRNEQETDSAKNVCGA